MLQLVGPISADSAKPLPADLSDFVEQGEAAGHGAVYVSMGTAARLTEAELHSLAGSLSALPNPVLWKLAPRDLPSELGHRLALAALFIGTQWQALTQYSWQPLTQHSTVLHSETTVLLLCLMHMQAASCVAVALLLWVYSPALHFRLLSYICWDALAKKPS